MDTTPAATIDNFPGLIPQITYPVPERAQQETRLEHVQRYHDQMGIVKSHAEAHIRTAERYAQAANNLNGLFDKLAHEVIFVKMDPEEALVILGHYQDRLIVQHNIRQKHAMSMTDDYWRIVVAFPTESTLFPEFSNQREFHAYDELKLKPTTREQEALRRMNIDAQLTHHPAVDDRADMG